MKHISGLFKPQEGTVTVFGTDLTKVGDQEVDYVRKRVGTLFQNYALFDSMTVAQNVAFPLVENDATSEDEAMDRAAELLEDLGLGDVLDSYPASLSGGMKKRVSVARSVVANPELLLLDDPTTGLDPVMTQFVDEMILDISKKYGLTTVIVSHNLLSIFRTADVIAVLDEGVIIAKGTPDEIRNNTDDRVAKYVGRLSRADIDRIDADDQKLDADDIVVSIKGLHKGFDGREILKGVDLEVPRRKITVIIGGSGAGKSVMMKHLLGLHKPDKGVVELFGNSVGESSESELRDLRTKIGMLFQHSALFDSMTVLDNVAFPLWERRLASQSEARKKAQEMLDQLKVGDVADRMPSGISNGQQKRVSLARALITEPTLMVYDEPTTGQDPIMSDFVEEMILEVQRDFDVTSIIISHDMASTFRIADQVALLHHGEILLAGTPSDFLDPEDERVRDFVFASQIKGGKESEDKTLSPGKG
jgi:ABC-type transporter Mla maintaining outer membrane lipid asymmetry ATPase subunit MlaF